METDRVPPGRAPGGGVPLPDFEDGDIRAGQAVDTDSLPNVESHELAQFVNQAAEEMHAEYKRIRRRAKEDPGTAGDEGEGNWQQLLRDWLPPVFPVVTKGRILSHDGTLGPQVDVLVLRSGYPQALVNKKTYLAGGVLAAFECKLTLKAEHIAAAAEKARSIRALVQGVSGTPFDDLHSPLLYGLLAHSTNIRRNPQQRIDRLLGEQLAGDSHPRDALDVLTVASLGTWRSFTLVLRRDSMPGDAASWEATRQMYGLEDEGSVTKHYMRAMKVGDPNWKPPAPLFELIEHLGHRLAWDHPEHRFLAQYWVRAGATSGATVASRAWAFDVMSASVAERVRAGALTNGDTWGRWEMACPC